MSGLSQQVRSLVAADSLEELDTIIDTRQIDGPACWRMLSRAASVAASSGMPAQANLLRYIADRVEASFSVWSADERAIVDVLATAATANSLFGQFLYLKNREVVRAPEALHVATRMLEDAPDSLVRSYSSVRVVVALLSGSRPAMALARLGWAIELRHRGRAKRALFHASKSAHEAMGSPHLQAMAANVCSSILATQGDPRLSISLNLSILQSVPPITALNRKIRFKPTIDLARSLRTIGASEDAIATIETALAEEGWPAPIEFIETLILKGSLNDDAGFAEVGRQAYHQAATHARKLGLMDLEYRALVNLGASFVKSRRYADARRVFSHLQSRMRDSGNKALEAASLNNLAIPLRLGGDLAGARRCLQRALALSIDGGDESRIARVESGLGNIATDQGNHSEAARYYARALDRAQACHDTELVFSLLTSGAFDLHWTARYSAILAVLIEDALAHENWHVLGDCTSTLIRSLVRDGKTVQAKVIGAELVERAASQAPLLDAIAARAQYGLLLIDLEDDLQEAFDYLWAARVDLNRLLEDEYTPATISEHYRKLRSIFESLVDILTSETPPARLPDTRSANELAFDLAEECSARGFLAFLSDTPLPPPLDVPMDVLEAHGAFCTVRRELRKPGTAIRAQSRQDLLRNLGIAKRHLYKLGPETDQIAPEYFDMRNGRPATLADARTLLCRHTPPGGMALVSYFQGRRHITCFVVRSGDLALHVYRSHVGQQDVAEAADALRRLFDGDPRSFPPYPPIRARYPQRRSVVFLERISRELFRFVERIGDRCLVSFFVNGSLGLLPLAALPTPDGRPLLERVGVTQCPSLSALRYILARPRVDLVSALSLQVAASEDDDPDGFEEAAAEALPAAWPVKALRGTAATPDSALDAWTQCSVVHLACHGFADRSDPLASGLVLSDGIRRPTKYLQTKSISERRQFVLSVRDIADLQSAPRLVSVQACSTRHTADDWVQDGPNDLVLGLLYSGVSSVATTLWNVDRTSSGELFSEIYRRLAGGEPAWQAVRHSQLALLNDHRRPWHRHLYHFGAVALVGDWR